MRSPLQRTNNRSSPLETPKLDLVSSPSGDSTCKFGLTQSRLTSPLVYTEVVGSVYSPDLESYTPSSDGVNAVLTLRSGPQATFR